jgi:predicted nucleic acid-binding protein
MESHLRAITRVVQPTEHLEAVPDDADDNKIIECAVAAGSEVVVTGDEHLLRLGSLRGIKIRRPAEFLAQGRMR